ncbi:MAG: PIG-L deacetylase family protein [Sphingobacteriales bacterium]
MLKMFYFLSAALFTFCAASAQTSATPMRIIMIGAHPDDCDNDGGGTAILLASLGHAVKFVSVTNGDAGHQTQGGGALAKRRMAEAKEAGKRFGVAYDVLDNHDGELLPSLDVRHQIIRKIREWNADVVIAPRPNDYHPDHRYTGVLVQDAAYMVTVPNVAPDIAPLRKNPVFLYFEDHFQRPNPFRPDGVVDITAVIEKKVHAMSAHESQYFEWLPWIAGYLEEVPKDRTQWEAWLLKRQSREFSPAMKRSLEQWYGSEKAMKVKYAEAFEICEYGKQPNAEDLRKIFPMLGK